MRRPPTTTVGRALAGSLAGAVAAASALALSLGVAAPAAAATTTRYEAESASLSGGAVSTSDHTGYSGAGFVGGYTDDNKGSAATAFRVTAAAAGSETFAIRYANGNGSAKTLSFRIDSGAVQQVSLPATANWNTWAAATLTSTLTAGTHTITVSFGSGDTGNVNLDALDLTPATTGAGSSTGPQFEAESATLTGGVVVGTDHTGFTGSGFASGFTDGNKGAAQVAFAVSRAGAGSTDLTLRYANGTGSAKTLSLVVDGGAAQQISLPATTDWNTWGTITTAVSLAAGNHTIAYRFGTADTGNVNIDALTVATTSTPTDPGSPGSGGSAASPADAESAFRSGGATVTTSTTGYTGTGAVNGFGTAGARIIRTLTMPTAGTATTTLRFQNTSGTTRTLALTVNGRAAGTIALTSGSGWRTATASLPFTAGINTVQLAATTAGSDVAIDSLDVAGVGTLAVRGATVPYTEYEAEAGTTTGTVLAADRTFGTIQAESSGRRAVRLDQTGQKVSVTLTQPANALTIRASIPDTANGAGQTAPLALYANGTKVKDVTLSSVYSWVYGAYPYNNNPSGGGAHRFYDDTRVQIGSFPKGTVLTLQKDASSTAASYTIDLIDAETVPDALTAPTGALSITSYGAKSDGSDSTTAITNAVAAAKAQGMPVWIPTGTFRITSRINVQGVTILGAGEWYSNVQGTSGKGGFFATGSNVTIANLSILGDVRYRDDAAFDAALEGNFGTGSLLQDIWIEHTKVGLWADSGTNGLDVVGLRIRDTFADGVNLHANVVNAVVEQTVVRNTGDDALAMFSDGAPVTDSAFRFDTVQVPVLANGIGIYGGTRNSATDSIVSDTVTSASGIAVGTRFNPVPLAGTTTIARNTLVRTGSREPNWATNLGALWIYADTAEITTPIVVTDMTITDSTYQAVLLSYQKTISNLSFDKVTISGAGTYGFDLNAAGSAAVSNTSVTGATSGGLLNETGYTLVRGAGNSGF
ncbi:CBM35 domain-containing protein [Curtobacterium sp. MCBA15_004]|uniref:CBM35 domain-containing protein n=1 Tax=Curtobacterium sp. MCBA15_004 TaxID=1898733 RepID=UPI000A5D687A|nr:CBM35 domain-containing protein [Curtobacterium sp. MCBA15_004]WIA96983.1 CBM35 domain-containing protein [Curtobacterium sp. MCBA15_004]